VYGNIYQADGTPVSNTTVQLGEVEPDGVSWSGLDNKTYMFAKTDASGAYQFDFVRLMSDPFEIKVKDPATGGIETVYSKIRVNGQWYRLDIFMRGRGILHGKVVNEQGNPVSGAYVRTQLENSNIDEYFSAVSSETGEFHFSSIPLGRINLFAAKGSASGSASIALYESGETANVNITVSSQKTGMVKGRVLKNDLLTPVMNSYVGIRRSSSYANEYMFVSKTNQEGYFEFAKVPVGSFIVEAQNPANGRMEGITHCTVIENQSVSLTLVFRGTGGICGTVLNSNGIAMQDVLVYIDYSGFQTRTNDSGEFTFSEVPIGNWNVKAYDATTQQQTSQQTKIICEGDVASTVLVFPPDIGTGSVSGNAVMTDGQTPAGGAWVYISTLDYLIVAAGKVAANGKYYVENIKPGNYLVIINLSEKYFAIDRFSVLAAGHNASRNLTLNGYGTIMVKVLAADGQTGIKAKVELNSRKFVMKQLDQIGFVGHTTNHYTDENGNLELNNVITGNFSVTASSGFYPSGVSANGVLGNDQQKTITLQMQENVLGKVQVLVVNPDGSPAENAKVTLDHATLPPQTLFTYSAADEAEDPEKIKGSIKFSLIPLGSFIIYAEDELKVYKQIMGGKFSGSATEVIMNVKLRGIGKISGQVLNNDGTVAIPLPNELIYVTFQYIGLYETSFFKLPYFNSKKTTNSQGYFEFNGVTAGNFRLSVHRGDLSGSASGASSGNQFDIGLDVKLSPCGSVTGRVLDQDQTTVIKGAQIIMYRTGISEAYAYSISDAEDGTFVFDTIPTGSFRLEAMDSRTGRQGRAYGKLDYHNQELNLDVTLQGTGKVSGTFYDAAQTQTIAGAVVSIQTIGAYPFTMYSTTDSQGRFSFDQIAIGNFTLTATNPSNGFKGVQTGKVEYDTHQVTADIISEGCGTVLCTVFKADGSTVVSPNTVKVELTSRGKTFQPTVEPDGQTLRFENIYIASFTIKASEWVGRDYGTVSDSLTYHGQEKAIELKFKGLGSVRGVVKDGSMNPVGLVSVHINSANESFDTVSSNDSQTLGEFSFHNLRLGKFSITAKDPVSNLSGTANGTLSQDGQEEQVSIELQSAGIVKGLLLNTDGLTPAAQAFVTLKGSGFTLYTQTDEQGEFLFPVVRLGDFTLLAEGYSNSGIARSSGIVSSDAQVVDSGTLILDKETPFVLSISPEHGAANIPFDTAITIVFSEIMAPASIHSATIKVTTHEGTVPGNLTISQENSRLITFTPTAPLKSFHYYTVTITTDCEDLAGNKLNAATSSSFTTVDQDPPQVIAVEPAKNASQILESAMITITFNEMIQTAQFGPDNFSLSLAGVPIAGNLSFNDSQTKVIFTPAAPLQTDSIYTIWVNGAQDLVGNTMTTAFTSSFTTKDTIAPTLTIAPAGSLTVRESSSVKVLADIGSSENIYAIYFFINGDLIFTDTKAPWECIFQAPLISAAGSSFLLEAVAADYAGNTSPRPNLTYALVHDLLPEVTLTGPADPMVKPGDMVAITVIGSDDAGLKKINFSAMGGNLNYTQSQNITGTSVTKKYIIQIPPDIAPLTQIQVQAQVTDTLGRTVTSAPLLLSIPADQANPTVTITKPSIYEGFDFKQIIAITASAIDDLSLKCVYFYVNDSLIATDNSSPYTAEYETPAVNQDTVAIIRAKAEDWTGKTAQHELPITFKKLVDVTAPQIRFDAPTTGSLAFAGEQLKLIVSGSDDNGIASVTFYMNDQLLDTVTLSNEIEFTASTTAQIDASLSVGDQVQLKAVATDLDGKTAETLSSVKIIEGLMIDSNLTITPDNRSQYENKTLIIRNNATVTLYFKPQQDAPFHLQNLIIKEKSSLTCY
jgi:hypothetical protein